MPSVFISPSTQEFNPYVDGGNEEYYMNLIADELIPYLLASGITVNRNNPDESLGRAIALSNEQRYDLHLALHSNAAPESLAGKLSGTDVYYYPTSTKGRQAADIIAANFKAIYPKPNLVNTKTSTSLAELRRTKAPAVLIEIAYHDNPQDAQWIRENIGEIAKNLALSVTEFLGVPFREP